MTAKRVLLSLFAVFVVAVMVDVKAPEPYGQMAPWHRVLDGALAIPSVLLIMLGPAFLCGFVILRFILGNQPLTLGSVAVLFTAGAAVSCSWVGHGPTPVMFFIFVDIVSLLFGQKPEMFLLSDSILSMLLTGGLVAAAFAWLSIRRQKRLAVHPETQR